MSEDPSLKTENYINHNVKFYNNSGELDLIEDGNFKEKWKKLVSESLDLGLTLEESLRETEPSTEHEFNQLFQHLEEIYFSKALSFEKEILPSSLEPETFLKKIKTEKGRSSKDIFLLSKAKYNFIKLGFKFESYLGAGAFGEAWKCSIVNEKLKKQHIYIKYKSKFIVAKFQIDKEGITSTTQEFSLMVNNSHPNVIKFLDYLSDCNVLIMEFCSNGSLESFLEQQNEPISLQLLFKFAEQLCDGLEYLHDRGIFHRDIRVSNILLDGELNIKIADFGIAIIKGVELSRKFENMQYVGKDIYGGLENNDIKKKHYWNIDIRFFGIILLKNLYFGEKVKTCGEQIENLFPYNCSPLMKKFILFCLTSKPLFEHSHSIRIIKLLLRSLKNTLLSNNNDLENKLTNSKNEENKLNILSKEEIDNFVNQLNDKNKHVRRSAILNLENKNLETSSEVISALCKALLNDRDEEVTSNAAQILSTQNLDSCPEAIISLCKALLSDKNKNVKKYAFENLGKQKFDFLFSLVEKFEITTQKELNNSKNEDNDNEQLRIPTKVEIDKLVKRLNDNNQNVRKNAVKTLGNQNLNSYPEAIHSLCKVLLNDKDFEVRRCAAKSFENQNLTLYPEAINSLCESLLSDTDVYVRRHAAKNLRNQTLVSHPDAINLVVQSLVNDKNLYVRRAVVKCLGNQNLNSFPEAISELIHAILSDEDKGVRKFAASSLGNQNLNSYPEIINSLIQDLVNYSAPNDCGKKKINSPSMSERRNVAEIVVELLKNQDLVMLKAYLNQLREILKQTKDLELQKFIFKIEQSK